MNTYTVTAPTIGDRTVQAYDWITNGGLVIFQDEIGRCVEAVAIEDGLRIQCAYEHDELFDTRLRLADARRDAALANMEAEIAQLTAVPNREQRRQSSGRR